MPTAMLETPLSVPQDAQKRWTRNEYRRLIAEGFLQDSNYELISGEIIKKMGQGRWHIILTMRIVKVLEAVFGYERIQSQATLPLGNDGEPEPDVAVLAQNIDQYVEQEPTALDTLLLIEVSNSTLSFDLTAKVRQYGSVGIPEYWVVDIPNRLLHVFREPNATGYSHETILTPEDEVSPLSAPESAVRVADLLP
jgi:Uma2 family endonuclease